MAKNKSNYLFAIFTHSQDNHAGIDHAYSVLITYNNHGHLTSVMPIEYDGISIKHRSLEEYEFHNAVIFEISELSGELIKEYFERFVRVHSFDDQNEASDMKMAYYNRTLTPDVRFELKGHTPVQLDGSEINIAPSLQNEINRNGRAPGDNAARAVTNCADFISKMLSICGVNADKAGILPGISEVSRAKEISDAIIHASQNAEKAVDARVSYKHTFAFDFGDGLKDYPANRKNELLRIALNTTEEGNVVGYITDPHYHEYGIPHRFAQVLDALKEQEIVILGQVREADCLPFTDFYTLDPEEVVEQDLQELKQLNAQPADQPFSWIQERNRAESKQKTT